MSQRGDSTDPETLRDTSITSVRVIGPVKVVKTVLVGLVAEATADISTETCSSSSCSIVTCCSCNGNIGGSIVPAAIEEAVVVMTINTVAVLVVVKVLSVTEVTLVVAEVVLVVMAAIVMVAVAVLV